MTDKLRVLIVDDEPLALDYMERLLGDVADVEIVARCRSGREALSELQNQAVDLMFLDIQMPGLNGLDVVKRCQSDVMPAVVFATAYDEYAVRAFEANAVDYLLKPFESERVVEAVSRAKDRLLSVALQSGKEAAVAAIAGLEGGSELLAGDVQERPARLPIKDGPHTHLVELETIDWIDAAGDYMCVHGKPNLHPALNDERAGKEALVSICKDPSFYDSESTQGTICGCYSKGRVPSAPR